MKISAIVSFSTIAVLAAIGLLAWPSSVSAQASVTDVDIPGMQMRNLPDLTVTNTVKVEALNDQHQPCGFIEIPKGVRFHPDAVDSTYAYETMMNGQYLRIKLADTNWAEVKPAADKTKKPEATATEEPHELLVDDEVVGRVKIDKILPNGFLGNQYETAEGSGEDDIYISGMDTSRLQEGNWWIGTVYYAGVWTQPGADSKTYQHFSVNPTTDKDVQAASSAPKASTGPSDASPVSFDEINKLRQDLQLQETFANVSRLTVTDTRAAMTRGQWGQTTPEAKINADVKRGQIQGLQSLRPAWSEGAKKAKDWLSTRQMPTSYRNWLTLVVSTNDAMGPATIGQFRRGVSKLITDWRVIQSLYGS